LKIGAAIVLRSLHPHRPARLLAPFAGKASASPPMWLMRQAGRHLPEYHEVRARAGSFLDLCYTPELAAEVTLQPVRRYGMDAAIVFSDILVVPHALGQKVAFVEGHGPRLDPIRSQHDLARLNPLATRPTFERVFETVANVRQRLANDVALIGFCGAPWTVATYMVSGGKGQADAVAWAETDPAGFARLVDCLVDASVDYLSGQVEAGADVLQIFDTWAGCLSGSAFDQWVCRPTKAIVARMKGRYPEVPIIGFPMGTGSNLSRYAAETGVDGVSCDTATPLEFMERELAGKVVVQGNLDPLLLASGGQKMKRQAGKILSVLADHPFIFNLGHGVLPQTPPDNVAQLVKIVRERQ
jgi:uroporphyrinogen decarboxylase